MIFEECGGFTPKIAEARMLMIALLAYLENKRSEISMSVLRRFIQSRVQTHGIGIEDLGAEWMAHQIRNDGVEKLPGGMPTTTATAEPEPKHDAGDDERIPKKDAAVRIGSSYMKKVSFSHLNLSQRATLWAKKRNNVSEKRAPGPQHEAMKPSSRMSLQWVRSLPKSKKLKNKEF